MIIPNFQFLIKSIVMEEYQSQTEKKAKKKITSIFDKLAIIVVIGIVLYIISGKMGCNAVTKEEKIEWIE